MAENTGCGYVVASDPKLESVLAAKIWADKRLAFGERDLQNSLLEKENSIPPSYRLKVYTISYRIEEGEVIS